MQFHDDYDSALNSKYYLAGKRLGAPTSPMTPKQLDEFGKRLNEGIQNVEIGTLEPDKFETIPEEHFREIKRLSKITNANVSMHAPLIEPSGFEERRWSEQKRISNEKQIGNVLERAGELGENTHVVLHGANVFGQQWEKDLKTMGGEEAMRAMAIVNEDSGETTILPYEKKRKIMSEEEKEYYKEKYNLPEKPKEIVWDPMMRLENLNKTQWDKEVLELFKFQKDIDELDEKLNRKLGENKILAQSGATNQSSQDRINRNLRDISVTQGHINELNQNFSSQFNDIINKVEKFSSKESKNNNIAEIKLMEGEYQKKEEEFKKLRKEVYEKELKSALAQAGNEKEREQIINHFQSQLAFLKTKSDVDKEKVLLTHLQKIDAPEVWKPVKEFAIEKASETIAGAAMHAFNKFGEKAPVLVVENSYPEMPLAKAEELKKGIEEARNKFVKQLIKEKGLTEDEAKDISKKLIGATWDIGHINLLRRAGYSEEEVKKLVLEETKKIASLVKHVHITDNFGFNDTHLPPGMGNVPVKEMLEELEKRGWKGPGIIEAGNFVKEFEISPFPHVLEYFESPLSSVYGGFKQDIYGPSFGTYIEFPKQHFDMYGSGFSTLPKELGGEMGGGEKSRFMQESGNQ